MRSKVQGAAQGLPKGPEFRIWPLAFALPLHRLRQSPSPLRGEDTGIRLTPRRH